MADRFYCPELPTGGTFALDPSESRHLARVRRVDVGETVEVFDGRGMGCTAEVRSLGKDRVELEVIHTLPDRRAMLDLTLATAVPKGERFDWLVEKATELGVTRLIPLKTERSTVDPRSAKLDRLRRVVVEASKQCGRNLLMALEDPVDWSAFLAVHVTADPALIVAHPGGEPLGSLDVGIDRPATLAVGPEGGFTDAEIESALRAGGHLAWLGPTLLRIETAAVAGCAVLLDSSRPAVARTSRPD